MRKKYEFPCITISEMDMNVILVGISDNGFDSNVPQEVNGRDNEEAEGWDEFWDNRE